MLSPYQFAANMPIWAKDLEGTEAIIMNKNDNTVTFVGNIFVVSEGGGKVSKTELKKATDKLIVNQLSKEARTLNGVEYRFELNYITEDLDGNPLTYESAAELAKESKVTHITSDGEEIIVEGPETGVVVASENATDQVKFSGNVRGQFIEHPINEDGAFNAIFLNDDLNRAYSKSRIKISSKA